MPGAYSRLLYHIVFSTRHRAAWLKPEIAPRVHEYLAGIIRGERGIPLRINGMPDHIHLLISWRTDESIAALVRNLKAHSSRWMRETLPGFQTFHWPQGYSVFTVSESQRQAVDQYIRDQEAHHRGRSWEEEQRALLRAHAVQFEEPYLLG